MYDDVKFLFLGVDYFYIFPKLFHGIPHIVYSFKYIIT